MRIFEHNFVADKAKMRRQAGLSVSPSVTSCVSEASLRHTPPPGGDHARQAFFTQSAAKFAEKTCVYTYVDRFLFWLISRIRLVTKKKQSD